MLLRVRQIVGFQTCWMDHSKGVDAESTGDASFLSFDVAATVILLFSRKKKKINFKKLNLKKVLFQKLFFRN